MTALLRALLLGALLAAGAAQAQAPAASAPAVAGTPQPDDSNARRAQVQPGNNAPMWRTVKDQGGLSTLPGAEKGVLIQPQADYIVAQGNAGEAWREVRNRWIIPYGGSLLLIVALALGIFYWRKGALGGHVPDTGRKIERFTPLERAAHWTNAGAFVVLAISGLTMAFGKFVLMPVIGSALFGYLTWLLKTLHNFVGPLFAVSLVIVIVTFIKDNIASASDFVWLSRLGGMLGDKEVPSHRFNAGEKGMFWWGVTVPGLVVVASGLVLDKLVPGFGEVRGQMQIAHMIHAVAAIGMMALIAGHIYMGTVGVKGALDAMKTGYVDEGWAKEHHELWYDDVKAGKIPAQRSAQPLPGAPRTQS
ncbi:formate dehydrogenase subunit gamma [Ideonella sp. 4Y16]|uniref:Formate dehydrogenase subunit gamma n=1 Tax=Ideonella alba TaxID=2824118 RepID=A0A941BE30_9BURK|nr:formate dehydrogenase subunit gamma [Ideonella alba]MBQ0929537.1 formate dehydrogenase subunit gamma [Ideonella alba]MBQ0944639.1 formate dehydrogenase subunit gamma [Ideonella alba]